MDPIIQPAEQPPDHLVYHRSVLIASLNKPLGPLLAEPGSARLQAWSLAISVIAIVGLGALVGAGTGDVSGETAGASV